MANGSAALHLAEPAPVSKDAPGATVGKPGDATEIAIGQAVADAVFVLYKAILDQQENDALAPATKDAGASRIARIALLQLDHEGGDLDFTRRAHEQGKRELRRFFNNTDYFRQHGLAEIDKVFDASISDVLGIVSRVVRTERTYRAAWAN
jgi:hypothetical protein